MNFDEHEAIINCFKIIIYPMDKILEKTISMLFNLVQLNELDKIEVKAIIGPFEENIILMIVCLSRNW